MPTFVFDDGVKKVWGVRCLVEKGDVAFVPHTAIFENTDGKNPALWAKDLKSTDFELLCPDGSRAPVNDYKKCKLSGIANQIAITRPESVKDVVRIIQNQQCLHCMDHMDPFKSMDPCKHVPHADAIRVPHQYLTDSHQGRSVTSLYGRTGSQKDIFQMFSSSYGQNLLFSDRTQCLVEFDRMLDRDIMDDYFGKPFHKHLLRDNDCLPKSGRRCGNDL
ncbi:unnamed protein product [Ranitomeya imitator]|uniref:Transferrin-like domain-containing protein n=1 Tax=Ranitomeya imitator TaxID=111125 RepID=A0ABN9LHY9_9NEOB|nr:unnamed protein product [Ranitomeya imitator]